MSELENEDHVLSSLFENVIVLYNSGELLKRALFSHVH